MRINASQRSLIVLVLLISILEFVPNIVSGSVPTEGGRHCRGSHGGSPHASSVDNHVTDIDQG
eukprot:m.64605 g.64605  ORF g.64605 m.64605 type:complete len:63 (+) comp8234_c0_seq3:757-945(+)